MEQYCETSVNGWCVFAIIMVDKSNKLPSTGRTNNEQVTNQFMETKPIAPNRRTLNHNIHNLAIRREVV
ncbi:MAG: hypothetical protein V4717_00675 [Bacteroidota bacterium]